MKTNQAPFLLCLVFLFALVASPAAAADAGGEVHGDRTVTQVVKLLQTLIAKSKEEGDTERNLFAKYKCYCDTNEEGKKAEIQRLTEEIAILQAKIEGLLASTAQLSREVQQLDADKSANELARQKAQSVRDKEHIAFLDLEGDLTQAIEKMNEAIQALSEIGADQTLHAAEDHVRYMAGSELGLSSLKSTMKKALLAASTIASKKQQHAMASFLQAPFTGVYSAQSGEVVGILKDMRETFKANLASATAVEAVAVAAHEKYMAAMQKAWNAMDASYNQKQGQLSANDGDLSGKRTQLEDAEKAKEDAEAFLASLLDMCAAKSKQYDQRVGLRTQEQAALSEAISILNSDDAFATFGTVQATASTGSIPSFVQIERHHQLRPKAVDGSRRANSAEVASDALQRQKAQAFLQNAAKRVDSQGSTLLGRIAGMLQANNPFAVVLQEIEKMIGLIDKEGKADMAQISWCQTERQETNAGIKTAKGQINSLTSQVNSLTTEIEDPDSGLLVQLDQTETSHKECLDNQASETTARKDDNVAYQKDIKNLVEAQALLERAVTFLQKYYESVKMELEGDAARKEPGLLQVRDPREPAPPETWEDAFTGQKHTGGTSAIGMLEYIIANTKKEESMAHKAEAADQHAYEDSMTGLKDMQTGLEAMLAELKATIARKKKELMEKQKDLAKTEAEKAALEAYLVKIKPGCDFITEQMDLRMGNRAMEKQGLEDARTQLLESPVYKEYLTVAHNESLHDCLGVCAPNEEHVDCKACLADVSVPGYCAGHPGTTGCNEAGAKKAK